MVESPVLAGGAQSPSRWLPPEFPQHLSMASTKMSHTHLIFGVIATGIRLPDSESTKKWGANEWTIAK